MKNFLTQLLQDETGKFSSKRFIGIIAGLTLCITLYTNLFSPINVKLSDTLINAVAMLSFGCLGLASVDKIWNKQPNVADTPEKEVANIVDEVRK